MHYEASNCPVTGCVTNIRSRGPSGALIVRAACLPYDRRMVNERRITVDGRLTRYLEAGSGRPLILIHAFPVHAELWQPQLARVPAGWRFVAPDLRGFGATSDGGTPAQTLDDHARDVRGLMDALDIESAVVGGLSMGGYVAFALFRLAPERFAGMVLADTRAQADSPEALRNRRALLELLRARGVGAVADDLMPKLLGPTTRAGRPAVVAELRRLIESNGASTIAAAVQALMSRPDSTPDLPNVRCPALVIVGEEDGIIPPADAEALQRLIAGSHYVVIPRAGHLSNIEAPEDFTAALSAFLAGVRL
jgi:3-oxoadipate enol-lactonase